MDNKMIQVLEEIRDIQKNNTKKYDDAVALQKKVWIVALVAIALIVISAFI